MLKPTGTQYLIFLAFEAMIVDKQIKI